VTLLYPDQKKNNEPNVEFVFSVNEREDEPDAVYKSPRCVIIDDLDELENLEDLENVEDLEDLEEGNLLQRAEDEENSPEQEEALEDSNGLNRNLEFLEIHMSRLILEEGDEENTDPGELVKVDVDVEGNVYEDLPPLDNPTNQDSMEVEEETDDGMLSMILHDQSNWYESDEESNYDDEYCAMVGEDDGETGDKLPPLIGPDGREHHGEEDEIPGLILPANEEEEQNNVRAVQAEGEDQTQLRPIIIQGTVRGY
jgi:hypothetical protein